MTRTLLAALAALTLLSSAAFDDAKDLKSKDPEVRLELVTRLAAEGGEEAEKLLIKALKDDDWEVAQIAADGLARHGGEDSVDALVKLAWDGPVGPLRAAAARSAAALDADEALKGLAKKMSGDRAGAVCDAYAIVLGEQIAADPEVLPKAPKSLTKTLKAKDTLARAAAAHALVLATRGTGEDGRSDLLTELFESEYAAVVAAALDAAAADPRPGQAGPLAELLRRPQLVDVIERRALAALARSLGADEAAGVAGLLASGQVGDLDADQVQVDMRVAERGARLVELLASGEAPVLKAADVARTLEPALVKARPGPRAAAARALRYGERDSSIGKLQQLAEGDDSARVRRAAVASLLFLADATDDGQRAWLEARLASEPDSSIREDLAVALGLEGLESSVAALVRALDDSDPNVAVVAAVSLGRTRSDGALAPLVALTGSGDWRLRGAAVMGLCHLMKKQGIPPIIAALADPEPLVAKTAHSFLRSINRGAPLQPELEVWQAWWTDNEKRIKLETPKEAKQRREEFGYASSPTEIYAGLDVMVFESRGDHMETVLDFLGLSYRRTSGNKVAESALDGSGVFVSNCTGEMGGVDVERLQWFVRVGGYLFGSCWAVTETVQRVSPGAVRQLTTKAEVLDQVSAVACDPDSPYLKDVFAPGVVPIYHLVGAHLIEVLEPERVEVLIDSPECAERWGGGNLAAWFRMGHGRILDSVNHFDAQGLAEAQGLKSEEDRMAYAVDHMGATYKRLRETRDEKWWSGSVKAAREIRDLSAFALITNFVKARRLESY